MNEEINHTLDFLAMYGKLPDECSVLEYIQKVIAMDRLIQQANEAAGYQPIE